MKNDASYESNILRPTLKQIQNLRRNKKTEGSSNEVGVVKEYLKKYTYDATKTASPHEAVEYKSCIKTGIDLNHLFTSLAMMMFIFFLRFTVVLQKKTTQFY